MDRNRQKYVELSLAGKWISLAREIIIDNPGITESRFVEIAAPLMPTHIQRNGKKAAQVHLAMRSLQHLIRVCKTVFLVDGKLTSKTKGNSTLGKGYTFEIERFAASNGSVSAKDLPHIKYFRDLANGLCKRGVLVRLGSGSYATKEANNDET